MALTDTGNDTIQCSGDTITIAPATSPASTTNEVPYSVVISTRTSAEHASIRPEQGFGSSYILTGIFLLALIIALRYRDNVRYITAIVHDLVRTRVRENVFDDTVRETSLLVMLNILWCGCVGITFYWLYVNLGFGTIAATPAIGMLYAMGMACVYSLFLYFCYLIVGWIFSDGRHAVIWAKGFAASQALMAPAFLLTALTSMYCRNYAGIIAICALVVFLLGKVAFIFKGYRIFFNQISSWVLFLCYLCSLEIVPLIICCRCASLLN